jgi:hypothetical protein
MLVVCVGTWCGILWGCMLVLDMMVFDYLVKCLHDCLPYVCTMCICFLAKYYRPAVIELLPTSHTTMFPEWLWEPVAMVEAAHHPHHLTQPWRSCCG